MNQFSYFQLFLKSLPLGNAYVHDEGENIDEVTLYTVEYNLQKKYLLYLTRSLSSIYINEIRVKLLLCQLEIADRCHNYNIAQNILQELYGDS